MNRSVLILSSLWMTTAMADGGTWLNVSQTGNVLREPWNVRWVEIYSEVEIDGWLVRFWMRSGGLKAGTYERVTEETQYMVADCSARTLAEQISPYGRGMARYAAPDSADAKILGAVCSVGR